MSNFSDFLNNNKNNLDKNEIKKQEHTPNEKKLEDMIENYSKYSHDELMNEFLKMTMKKKKQGELSSEELNSIKSTIMPYLTDEQKLNMEKLLKMVEYV